MRIVDQLQAAVVGEPLREPLHELLILALYRCDRRAEAFLAFENARRVLRDELGTDPGPRLRELHQRMLRSDPDLRVPHQVLAPAARPAQLPTDLPVFVGRKTALAAARATLPTHRAAPERTTVIVIGGTAGVGKTAFALHWAHQITDRFTDGQLYVNLRGFEGEGVQVGPQETIMGFLHALGVHPQRIPPTADAQAALYRSLLLDRRCLIVLDNARDSAQVLPCCPAGPAAWSSSPAAPPSTDWSQPPELARSPSTSSTTTQPENSSPTYSASSASTPNPTPPTP